MIARTKTPAPVAPPPLPRAKTPLPIAEPPPPIMSSPQPIVPARTATPPIGVRTQQTRVAPNAITKLTPAPVSGPVPAPLPPVRSAPSQTPTLSLPIVTRPPAPPTPPEATPVIRGEAAPEPIVDGPISSAAPVAATDAEQPDTTRTHTPPPDPPEPAPAPTRGTRARTPNFNELLASPGAFALAPTDSPESEPEPPAPEPPPPAPEPPARQHTREIAAATVSEPAAFADEPSVVVAGDAFVPPAETRTPGSDFVLPANPLANLSDDQLQGFIDCTIYEETSNFFETQDASVDVADVSPILRPSRTRTLTPLPLPADPDPARPFRSPTGVPFALTPTGEPVRAQRISSPPFAAPSSLPLPLPLPPEPAVLPDEPTRTLPPQPVGYPAPGYPYGYPIAPYAPSGAVPVFPPVPGYAAPVVPPAPRGRHRWWLIAGSGVVAIARVVVAIIATRSSEEPAPEPAVKLDRPAAAKTPKPAGKPTRSLGARDPAGASDRALRQPSPSPSPPLPTPPEPPPESPTAPSDPAEAPAGDPDPAADDPADPAIAGGLPVVGSGPCRINVTVTPAGSQVKADGRVMGVSPLAIDSPCEKRRLDIAHVRYASTTRFVTPVLDRAATVEVALARPTHALTVVTVPAGATISIEGRRAGTTPTVVQLMGFYGVTLTIEKKGYKTATQRVYSKLPRDRITVRLLESFK